MDDAGAMRGVERAGDLDGDRQRFRQRQGRTRLSAPRQTLLERFAVEQLHHEEGGAVVIADVEQRADVGVGELRDRARFAVEPLAQLRIGGERAGSTLIATVRSSRVSRAL